MVAIGIIAYFSGALPQCTFTFVAVSIIMIDIGIIAIIASFSGALPQCTFTNKNPTAAGALADYCQFLRQNPFMVSRLIFAITIASSYYLASPSGGRLAPPPALTDAVIEILSFNPNTPTTPKHQTQ